MTLLFQDPQLYKRVWRTIRRLVSSLVENPARDSERVNVWEGDSTPGLSDMTATREGGYIRISFRVDPYQLLKAAL